ncbi:toxin-antitoxin system, toxin component, PIN family [Leptospira noguchii str. 2006001870]|nr:toxin-antitoxin system, toxin component, PIN family [Leptospira noguchii str. 2006001870]
MNKRWLDESLTRQRELLTRINLKRIGSEIYDKIQKTDLFKISGFDPFKHRFVNSRFPKKETYDRAYDRNIRKIASDFNFYLCSFVEEKRN